LIIHGERGLSKTSCYSDIFYGFCFLDENTFPCVHITKKEIWKDVVSDKAGHKVSNNKYISQAIEAKKQIDALKNYMKNVKDVNEIEISKILNIIG